jgi:hypothetical protein
VKNLDVSPLGILMSPCSFDLSATRQQYFLSERTNH